jgi:hypothetical protein
MAMRHLSIARAQAKLYQERMVAFYSNKAAVPPCPCSQASDDFEETENPSGDRQTSSSNINLEPMLQDLPGELEGQTCCRDDILLQLRDRHQWQVEHMSQRPVMYNIVIIKGMHPATPDPHQLGIHVRLLIAFVHAEPFAEIQRLYPELIAIDEKGVTQPARDLWLKEAQESIKLAGASRLDENVWVSWSP